MITRRNVKPCINSSSSEVQAASTASTAVGSQVSGQGLCCLRSLTDGQTIADELFLLIYGNRLRIRIGGRVRQSERVGGRGDSAHQQLQSAFGFWLVHNLWTSWSWSWRSCHNAGPEQKSSITLCRKIVNAGDGRRLSHPISPNCTRFPKTLLFMKSGSPHIIWAGWWSSCLLRMLFNLIYFSVCIAKALLSFN